MEIKKYRGIIFHDTEQWYKIWIKLDLKVSKLTMMGSFWPKRNASARKFQRNYVSWHWKAMQNLSENWFVVWKMTRNLVNFHASSWKTENLLLMGFFHRKPLKFLMKKYRRIIFHDTGECCKVWRKLSLCFKKWHDEFGKF